LNKTFRIKLLEKVLDQKKKLLEKVLDQNKTFRKSFKSKNIFFFIIN